MYLNGTDDCLDFITSDKGEGTFLPELVCMSVTLSVC